jgi:probable F420-dependent oxidoreductase
MKFVLSTSFNTIEDLMALAPVADESGWDSLTFSDHIVHPETISTPYPYTEDGSRRWEAFTDWPDPWVLIGALAAMTKRIRFTNNVYVLPMRNPFMAAKAISTAAVISNNRVTLTIGMGWSSDEFALVEQPFERRGKRADEMVEVMRKLWTGEWVEHHGEFYEFERLEMTPAPTERIPIYVGGISKFAFRRSARLGDGWLSDLQTSAEIVECINTINNYRKDYGRDHLPFDVMASPSDAFTLDHYKRLEDQGVTHLLTMPWPFYPNDKVDPLTQKSDAIKRFSDEIIAKMD